MSIRGDAAIVGFYELPTQKEYPGRSTTGLLAEVARGAIRDAGLRKEDIDGLISSEGLNSLTLGQALAIKPQYTRVHDGARLQRLRLHRHGGGGDLRGARRTRPLHLRRVATAQQLQGRRRRRPAGRRRARPASLRNGKRPSAR